MKKYLIKAIPLMYFLSTVIIGGIPYYSEIILSDVDFTETFYYIAFVSFMLVMSIALHELLKDYKK